MIKNEIKHYEISILVPVYNVEKYIERCARSLFEQSFDNIEYIFINDCTTDTSWEILHKIIEEYPKRKPSVKLSVHDKNRGLSAVRNTGISLANGKYICWVDSDDYIDKNMVRRLLETAKELDADIVTCNFCAHYPDKIKFFSSPNYKSPKEMCVLLLEKKVPVCVWSRLIKRSLYKDHNILALEGVNNAEDYQQMPKLAFYSQKVVTIDDYLYHYNCENENSYTYRYSINRAEQVWTSIESLFSFFQAQGDEYCNALNRAKALTCAKDIIGACEISSPYYFSIAHKRLLSITDKDVKCLPIRYRLLVYIKNYYIAKTYVKFSLLIKRLF